MYTTNITLDLNAENCKNFYFAKQGDNQTRAFKITLTADGLPYTGDVGNILFRVEKPDRHAVIVSSTDSDSPITINSDGTITVVLTSSMLAAAGKAICDIELLDASGYSVSTMTFYLFVMPSPDVANTAVSTDDFKTLQDLIAKAQSGGVTIDANLSATSTNPVQNKAVYAALQSVSVPVDSSMSSTSTNPVQNKVINAELQAIRNSIPSITVDSTMSSTSENPVQNKVIYSVIGDIESALEALI